MNTLTIGKRILIIVAILGIALAATGLFAIVRLLDVSRTSETIVKRSIPGIAIMGRINARQSMNQLRAARMLRTADPVARAKIKDDITASASVNTADYAAYEALLNSDEGRRVYQAVIDSRQANTTARNKFFQLAETDLAAATVYADASVVPAFNAYFEASTAAMTYNENTAMEQGREIEAQVANTIRLLLIVSVIALVVGIALSILNLRAIVGLLGQVSDSLDAGAQQTTSAAGQVSSASQQLAEGSTQQAASLEETSASLEEISSMTKRNAENAQRAKELAAQARHAADAGVSDMNAMKTAMDEIKASSDDIAKIIKTIDEIAFQTNILALNAAVEAARAGEAGAGFAVVAEEVRNLAQRSAQAAKDTASKIEGAISKTSQGVGISNKVASSLEEIATRSRQVDELVVEIATASTEQNQGIGQVTQAVAQMDQITQKNAANAEESASAAEELNAQAASMQDNVRQLLALAGRTAATHSVAQARSVAHTKSSPRQSSAVPHPGKSPHDAHFADLGSASHR